MLNIPFPEANLPTQPLAIDIINRIKSKRVVRKEQILPKPKMDTAPSSSWANIFSASDKKPIKTRSIAVPMPPQPVIKSKLAILYSKKEELEQIANVLKSNL